MSAPFCLVLSSLSPPNSEHVPGLSNLQIILKRALFLAKPTPGTLPALKDTPISVDLQAGEGFPDTPICNRSLAFRLGRAFKTIRMDGFPRLRNPLTGARLRSLLFLRLSASPGTCKGESKKLPVDRASGERRFGAGRDIFYVRKKNVKERSIKPSLKHKKRLKVSLQKDDAQEIVFCGQLHFKKKTSP